jgi:hypothetical protein
MEVGLEVSAKKAEYILLSCHQNARKNYDTGIVNRSYGNVAHLKCLGITISNGNFIQQEIHKIEVRQCSLGFSARPFVFSSASKDAQFGMYATMIFAHGLEFCEILSLT